MVEASDDEHKNQDLGEEPPVAFGEWSNKNFERLDQTQIKRARYTYVNGLFKPENGPYLLQNAFQNENNVTLRDILSEICNIMKDDLEAQYVPYARTCVCAIVPTTFKPQMDLLRQGNYYQYDLLGKY